MKFAKTGSQVKILLVLIFAVSALLAIYLLRDYYPSIDQVKAHRQQLLTFIQKHYLEAVFFFICLYLGTALFLPGALALTVAGGMMFGTIPALIYVNIGGTMGAAFAFLAARFIIGGWIQDKFRKPLGRINRELTQHGHNYLLILRILPIVPHFIVNYGAGVSKIPFRTFVWTTSLGMFPGSLIYAFIGKELGSVNAPQDLFSAKIILSLVLIASLAIAPVIIHHLSNRNK